MSVGFVLLTHTAFNRATEVARHWAMRGCPVVVHVDRAVPKAQYAEFHNSLADLPNVRFSKRHRCEWGTWGIVAASQAASELMLSEFPDVQHVYLSSGSCMPLRPVEELRTYLGSRPNTDFIESVTTEEVPWTIGGLDTERFTLRFPFAWKRQRKLFDASVRFQRRFKYKRSPPNGVEPHLGSQWWCLTRNTLEAILQSPRRSEHDRYFRRVWIPDESYYQSLVRLYSSHIESRSLTLSKFDFQGKPHIFYDDHLQLLRRSDCFVARKIWPHAERLYSSFLHGVDAAGRQAEPNPGKIDRIFSKAVERRTRGRSGLYMQSRFPNENWENGVTSAPYSVFEGFGDLFTDFEPWLAKSTGARVHKHLFAKERVQFNEGQSHFAGAISDNADLRDYNPHAFLSNLIWNTRGERQCFLYGPDDAQDISWFMAKDPNAQISVISGAWAVPLFHSAGDFSTLRKEAARLQQIEAAHLDVLRSPYARAKIRIWTLSDFVEAPMEALQSIADEIGSTQLRRLSGMPRMVSLTGFTHFLQRLRNGGMNPHLVGDFRDESETDPAERPRRKVYQVH